MGLAYERLGSGPPLVLLHGVGHRRQAWGAVLDRLTPHRDVIAVDLPGHGESPPLDEGLPILDALLGPVRALLDDLGVARPHVAGNSLGGRLALEAAVAGWAASATALSPAGFWRTSREATTAKAAFAVMEAAGSRLRRFGPALSRHTAGRAVVYAGIVSRPSRMPAEQALGDMTAFLAAHDTVQVVLAQLTAFNGQVPAGIPVTIAWGTKDRLLRPRQVLVAKQRLPRARIRPLPGCGHVPMTDDPALVADVLLQGSGHLAGEPAGETAANRRPGGG
jgi:pimeloyl-ACP methyl ester carboxylesterase